MNELIDRYEKQGEILAATVGGLTRSQLLSHPVPGTWSIQQITVHLADCEQVFSDRIKRVIAEDKPPLLAFDENKWMASLAVDSRPAEESARLLSLTRRQLVTILRQLPPEAASRVGIHSEQGVLSLADLLRKACDHFDHHLKFLIDKKHLVTRS
jgi:uncharacterized damage-inducible protein DinB